MSDMKTYRELERETERLREELRQARAIALEKNSQVGELERENAALVAERDGWRKSAFDLGERLNNVSALCGSVQNERDALAAQVGALRADKARLDWLDEWSKERDAVYEEGDPDVGMPSCWQIWSRQTGSEKRRMLQYAPSLRAAIDAALAATPAPAARKGAT